MPAINTNVDQRLLRTTKFPPEFDRKVDSSKVNFNVMTLWINEELVKHMGMEDEIVKSLLMDLLTIPKYPDIKNIQIQLTGFLNDNAPVFCKDLWNLLLDAQGNDQGVPQKLIEAKKLEMKKQQEEAHARHMAQFKEQEERYRRDRELDRVRREQRIAERSQRETNRGRSSPDPRGSDSWTPRGSSLFTYDPPLATNNSNKKRRTRSPSPDRRRFRSSSRSRSPPPRHRRYDSPPRRRRSRSPPRRQQDRRFSRSRPSPPRDRSPNRDRSSSPGRRRSPRRDRSSSPDPRRPPRRKHRPRHRERRGSDYSSRRGSMNDTKADLFSDRRGSSGSTNRRNLSAQNGRLSPVDPPSPPANIWD